MSKRVLLIEYEPRYVERLTALLSARQSEVTVAHDGEEGLNFFSASPGFDLVLLSGMLPRLPSAEVIREIRKRGGATAPPILLLVTGYKGKNPKADAQKVGAFDILVKPFSDETLLDAVQTALASTDFGAKTMRIPTLDAAADSRLTSSDIFSDILEDVEGESLPRGAVAPSTRAASTAEEVERRLRDTLSGILDNRSAKPSAAFSPAAKAPSGSASRFSTDAEIDRLISDTLSGITPPARQAGGTPRPAAAGGASGREGKGALADILGKAASAGTPVASLGATSPAAALAGGEPGGPPRPLTSGEPGGPPPLPATENVPAISGSGPDRFGQYQIEEKIATGGMAELYKAKRSGVEGFQKVVAIKKILPHIADNEEFITMFADEAKLAAQLNHPNIVHIYDLGKIESGGYFIAMEYVDGRDLKTILQSAGELAAPLPVPLAVLIAAKVASALDYAHRRRDPQGRELNIVHRDVSPQNILISYEGDIKLCDFGIAKAATKASQTQSGALKGKVQYMSPEQAWGKRIDRRSDIFSLGAVLSEMLTGEKLFRGDSDLTVLEKVRAAAAAAPSSLNPDVPKTVDAIVLKALSREPENRYANASDLLRDLESVLYSFTPAPGSADLAIFLHRLQTEEATAEEARRQESARTPEEPGRKRRSKEAPLARRATGSVPLAASAAPAAASPAPAKKKKEETGSGVFGAFSSARVEAEKRSRKPLLGMIGVGALALTAGVYWALTRGSSASTRTASVTPAAVTPLPAIEPSAVVVLPPAAPTPLSKASGIDPRAVEAEVERQVAARRKELQKALEESQAAAAKAKEQELAAIPEVQPVPTPEPAAARIEPTAAPTEPAVVADVVPTRPPPVPQEPEVSPGDLVGPGPGVVEPALLGTPRVAYPPIARQQRVSGKVVVLVLVSERGAVMEARLQQGVASRTGVNEAVVEAVRGARFRPATKNGVPVKMWRTVVVDVKP